MISEEHFAQIADYSAGRLDGRAEVCLALVLVVCCTLSGLCLSVLFCRHGITYMGLGQHNYWPQVPEQAGDAGAQYSALSWLYEAVLVCSRCRPRPSSLIRTRSPALLSIVCALLLSGFLCPARRTDHEREGAREQKAQGAKIPAWRHAAALFFPSNGQIQIQIRATTQPASQPDTTASRSIE